MGTQTNKWKWVSILGVLLIFMIGTYIATADQGAKLTNTNQSKPQRKAKPVNMDKLPLQWKEADSFEEVKQFYKRKLPPIEMARKKNLTTFPAETATVEGLEGRVQINEVWHNGRTVHYLYSMDLSLLVEDDDDNSHYIGQPPHLEELIIERTEDSEQQTVHAFSSLRMGEAIIYKNRLYALMQSIPFTNRGPSEMVYGELNHPEEPVDHKAETSLKIRINGKTYQSGAIPVHYSYEPKKQLVKAFSFEGKYSENGLTIEPLEMKVNVSNSYLTMKVISEEKPFSQSISGHFMTGNGQRVPLSPYTEKVDGQENVYRCYFRPLVKVPEDVELILNSIQLKEDASITFTADIPSLSNGIDHLDKTYNKKVATKSQTDIFLKRIQSNRGQGVELILNYRPQTPGQNEQLLGPSPRYHANEKKAISFKADNGVNDYADYGSFEKTTNIHIPYYKLDGASRVTVTLNELVYSKQIKRSFNADEK